MIDCNLKPYLLEVNHTPSFQTDSPLDYSIKKNLIIDVFNVLQLKTITKNKNNKVGVKVNKNKKNDNVQSDLKKLGNFEQLFPNRQFDSDEYNSYMNHS